MKHALIVGGGKGKGAVVVDTLLANGYDVTNIGASMHSVAKNITVEWKDLDITWVQKNCKFDQNFDIVFFNQNSSSLCEDDFVLGAHGTLETWKLLKDWTHSHWLSCQFPYLLLHSIHNNLHSNTKVGWMLSSYIKHDKLGVQTHADYSSFKYFNFLQQKCFNNKNDIKTFAIYPDFDIDNSEHKLYNIIVDIIANNDKHKEYYF